MSRLDGHDLIVEAFHLLSDDLTGPDPTSSDRGGLVDAKAGGWYLSEDHRRRLAEICRRFGVRRVSLVGRSAGPDFDPTRDVVELLVETGRARDAEALHPDRNIDRWVDFGFEVEAAIDQPVELLTPEEFTADPPVSWDPTLAPATIELWSLDRTEG